MEDRSHNPFVNAPLTDARSTNNNNNVDQNNENKNVNPNPFNLPPKADPKPEVRNLIFFSFLFVSFFLFLFFENMNELTT